MAFIPTYTVEERKSGWAVMRSGPRGGTKFMVFYHGPITGEKIARELVESLNNYAHREV